MKFITRHNKKAAFILLLVMLIQTVAPTLAYGLTSGPSQPEMKGFQPIGNSDMVDLFSGDFSYNIPLMDAGGYPINMSYQSGASMDDEASWVGYGWGLNVGSLNRNLRGIPDDFNGTDKIEREINTKNHKTYGAGFSATLDLLGIPVDKILKKLKKKKLNFSKPSISVNVKYDNYRGIGMEFGGNVGLTLSDYAAGDKTKGESDTSKAPFIKLPGLNFNLSSMDGASAGINYDIINKNLDKEDKYNYSKAIKFAYNTRAGLAGMTLESSMSAHKSSAKEKPGLTFESNSASTISFNGDTYTPSIDHETSSNSFTFAVNLGPEIFVAFPGGGVKGFYSEQTIPKKNRKVSSYGYLNSHRVTNINDALLDFNREKDIPYSNEVNYLPIPISSYDLFSATSQDGGGQYRAYRGSSGVYFDNQTKTRSDNFSLGIEIGAGTYFTVGADIFVQDIKTKTQKWIDRNKFLAKGDFKADNGNPLYETAYFKRVGEPVPYDKNFVERIKGTGPVAVKLPRSLTNAVLGAETTDVLRTKNAVQGENTSTLVRNKREVRNTTFSYLTAKEAANHALDKTIKDLHPDSLVISNCTSGGIRNSFSRAGGYRAGHHISEVTVTGDDGKRNIYGIPVYNTYQEEVSFSTDTALRLRKKGLTSYVNGTDNTVSNKKGRENYYSKEITPPYATSFLLTSILSPDYVDLTRNGITDDDLGTAVKFNYSKLNSLYGWRTPYAMGPDTANYNEGFLNDNLDDKANYLYGKKEIWYLHSIESKTMIAQFVTEDRDDALGVVGSRGQKNTAVRLKRLKEIRLYSKSDLRLNGNDPSKTIPIKVVHFEYDYSLCRGVPNSGNGLGKLTLKKVYFTFGQNNKGKLHPYQFEYDTAFNFYDYRQYDRWGNFKDAAANANGLNNSEFPYTLQNAASSNAYAAAWQLKKISLPSGGTINVTYESDDYAYVQDRRASQMCFLNGVNAAGSPTNMVGADYIFVDLPYAVASQKEMLERYFEGIKNLYYKFFIDLDAKGHKEFVPGYAEIVGQPELVGTNIAKIKLKKIKGINPIAKAGWQFLRTNLAKYAYPGSENLESTDNNLVKSIKALFTALGSIKEFFVGFEKRAKNKGYSNNVDLSKSWVRLCSPEWKKLGGGCRVKKIDIADNWQSMSGTAGAATSTYTQVYDYTKKDGKDRTISSGVASYEPTMGNDENPFRQPVNYKQGQFLGLDTYYYIEEPFGESFFPGASVGYSKVTVKSIGSGDAETVNRTGVSVSEFYTAKDYPVKLDNLGLEKRKPLSDKIFKLIGGVSFDIVGLSQGYSIELNDMHGKPKTMNIFNKSGENISSMEYFYKSENELAEKKSLKNDVKVINPDGTVTDGTIGMDIEMFNDMRQQTTDNLGVSMKVSGGSGAILFFPLPFFFPGIGINYDQRSYRASSTVKIIQRFAVQYKVKKVENGSSITSENLTWDAETGNVLLTKTQNEFDDPIYSFAYPAHWFYNGMGQAYQNLGTIFSDLATDANGKVTNVSYYNVLAPGDELININNAAKYWVANSPLNQSTTKELRLIDSIGNIVNVSGAAVKLLRSGRRNMANTAIATIASLNNPIVGDKLNISQLTKILDAKATVFNEEWSVPGNFCVECPPNYTLSADGNFCIKDTAATVISGCFTVCEGSHDGSYSSLGTEIYSTYNVNGTGQVQASITNPSNRFWVGGTCAASRSASLQLTKIDSNATSTNQKLKPSKNQIALRQDICDGDPNRPWNAAFCGPLHRSGIWSCWDSATASERNPVDEWIGFSRCIQAASTKTYYLGIAGDNQVRFYIDGVLTVSIETCNDQSPFTKWRIYPILLQQGQHTIQMEGYNCGSLASFGAEIYDNTVQELVAATSLSNLSLIFSTRDMVGQELDVGHFSCPDGYTLNTCTNPFTCKSVIPVNKVMNPYYSGILGNWRAKSQYVYQISRENLTTDPSKFGNTDIRRSGAYSVFNPFYTYQTNAWVQNPTNDAKWIAANEMTGFNSKGLDIESKDALNRYSSALFGYLESMPVAVASNSQYREIAYDGFEDYGFSLDCITPACSNAGHFNFSKKLNGTTITASTEEAHTGKFSLKLNGSSVTLYKTVYTANNLPLFSFDNTGRFLLGSNEQAKGFSPIPGKNYVLSYWVKDQTPRSPSTPVTATINGVTYGASAKWPIVEGWKRVEVQFPLSAVATGFSITLQSGGGAVYVDDIRIHPVDGQMKSFAYDPSSQRLWAELDENNFATLYEYDDEGILIRVKKETERGIMTIKETRSSYKKQ